MHSQFQLGVATGALYRQAGQIDAQLYIAHLEPALPAALELMRTGRLVGVDMEDWYSEDLLPEAREGRPIPVLRKLEQQLLQDGAHTTCPSRAMSEALATTYACLPPTVIYNSFSWVDRQRLDHLRRDRRDKRIPSIHWYSQTVGPGRGLEELLAALPHLAQPAEIHLRGKPVAGFDRWFSARMPEGWRDRIFVHGLVPSNELLSRIAEHDIGFAGEMKYARSRDLTITNKMLQYLLAGVAVVASDTAGQREVAAQASDAVRLYPSGDAVALATQLNALLGPPERLRCAKAAALRAAQETFCWERQEAVLLASVTRALRRAPRAHSTHESNR
ncbi:MAG: glycosyltransferase [Candidatus Binatia bacterium]